MSYHVTDHFSPPRASIVRQKHSYPKSRFAYRNMYVGAFYFKQFLALEIGTIARLLLKLEDVETEETQS